MFADKYIDVFKTKRIEEIVVVAVSVIETFFQIVLPLIKAAGRSFTFNYL